MREAKKNSGCKSFDICHPFCLGGAASDSPLPHTAQSGFVTVGSDFQDSSHRHFFTTHAAVLSPVDFCLIYYHVNKGCTKLCDSCS